MSRQSLIEWWPGWCGQRWRLDTPSRWRLGDDWEIVRIDLVVLCTAKWLLAYAATVARITSPVQPKCGTQNQASLQEDFPVKQKAKMHRRSMQTQMISVVFQSSPCFSSFSLQFAFSLLPLAPTLPLPSPRQSDLGPTAT